MRHLSDTLGRLARLSKAAEQGATRSGLARSGPDRLLELTDFGSNPGSLRARSYIPVHLPAGAPLVVVLHGCTQTAADYDCGSGWSALADRHHFALLFPEQQRSNNAHRCFNWFEPEDTTRGAGEVLSIHQMVEKITIDHALDRRRIYITGLSAGGAMAAVMLATYPEVFAGGAIIAGLPYGCATTIPEAFDRMRGHGIPSEIELQRALGRASPHVGPWPSISVWHGTADHTVSPANAEAIIAQWRGVHGVAEQPTRTTTEAGYPRRIWCDAQNRVVIEEFSITGMGHGTPIDTVGPDGCGKPGAYMLEVGISSTRHLARFWGLEPGHQDMANRQIAPPDEAAPASNLPVAARVRTTIENALRSAGLMRSELQSAAARRGGRLT